ncbi:hypothetical protein [Amycolatopsis keratiniphila]|uniref:hypothetical protein n=1 Tax=Amycolatopsis keratiniphila TaxID=129921 RepID=UPI00117F82E5|nr:hypothetical protein [Amycolatopsis keratiniphila]
MVIAGEPVATAGSPPRAAACPCLHAGVVETILATATAADGGVSLGLGPIVDLGAEREFVAEEKVVAVVRSTVVSYPVGGRQSGSRHEPPTLART